MTARDNAPMGGQGGGLGHEYGPSMVGHGDAQCVHCFGTNRENAVIAPDLCPARVSAGMPTDAELDEAVAKSFGPEFMTPAPDKLPEGSGETWHRGWLIAKAFFGYAFQHPGYDPENQTDWRYGNANTVQEARDEIDRLLADDAEWTAATEIFETLIGPTRPQPAVLDEQREAIARIVARAYGGSLHPGLGVPGDYPTDDVDYRAADAILAHIASTTAAAVQAEREACAKVADDYDHFGECGENDGLSAKYVKTEIATAIRTRDASEGGAG